MSTFTQIFPMTQSPIVSSSTQGQEFHYKSGIGIEVIISSSTLGLWYSWQALVKPWTRSSLWVPLQIRNWNRGNCTCTNCKFQNIEWVHWLKFSDCKFQSIGRVHLLKFSQWFEAPIISSSTPGHELHYISGIGIEIIVSSSTLGLWYSWQALAKPWTRSQFVSSTTNQELE